MTDPLKRGFVAAQVGEALVNYALVDQPLHEPQSHLPNQGLTNAYSRQMKNYGNTCSNIMPKSIRSGEVVLNSICTRW